MHSDKKHPYVDLPDYQFWKKEPGILDPAHFDPITNVPFEISADDKVITAGSCFAQHVARYLSNSGFNHFITENPHPLFDSKTALKHNYGVFTARYGNVYTTRQLKQLLQRAFDEFQPSQAAWALPSHNLVDPFRPQIQPNGFCSEQELKSDIAHHLQCAKEAFQQTDVFVFTLGLTESWVDPNDGAVFPLAPGIAGGRYSNESVKFKNFDLKETILDLEQALTFIRQINPDCKFILTVSPVPLNATYEDRHVLVSTTHSKAVLRLAAEEVSNNFTNTVYFPSFEIITSPYARGQYFEADCRSVTPAGVEAVMSVFLRNFSTAGLMPESKVCTLKDEVDKHLGQMESKLQALCDEEAIDNS